MFFFLTSTMYRCLIILIGVLYPAFNSYKALNRRNGYDQVKWMMYWIVFAVFTACEVVTDLFFSWMPLYNESKIIFVLWMVLPMSRGSSYLYRKIIHPNLLKHEQEIDRYIAAASNKGCEMLFQFGQHGMNYAANAVLQTADHLKRSYSVGDVSKSILPPIEPMSNNLNQANGVGLYYQYQEDLNFAYSYDSEPEVEKHLTRTTRNSSKKQGISNKKTSSGCSANTSTPSGSTRRARKALHKLEEEC